MNTPQSKQVIISDVIIGKKHLLQIAKQIHTERTHQAASDEQVNSVEVIAEALCLAWVDYLDELLEGKSELPFTLSQHVEKHEKYFQRWGI